MGHNLLAAAEEDARRLGAKGMAAWRSGCRSGLCKSSPQRASTALDQSRRARIRVTQSRLGARVTLPALAHPLLLHCIVDKEVVAELRGVALGMSEMAVPARRGRSAA